MEFVAIVGPSGCGKTTLSAPGRPASSFPTTTVRVSVGGDRGSADRAPIEPSCSSSSRCFHGKPSPQNIAFRPEAARGVPRGRSSRASRVRKFVAMINLDGHENSYPHQLSGGMQQRVAIARSLRACAGRVAHGSAVRGARCANQDGDAGGAEGYLPEPTRVPSCSLRMQSMKRSIWPTGSS